MISGYQMMCDFGFCNANIELDAETVTDVLKAHAVDVGFTVVQQAYHQFDPHGVTSVLVLSESHIVIHTWPERRSLSFDVFVCSAKNKYKMDIFISRLEKTFQPENKLMHLHMREDFLTEDEYNEIKEIEGKMINNVKNGQTENFEPKVEKLDQDIQKQENNNIEVM